VSAEREENGADVTYAIETHDLAKTYRSGFFLRPVVGLRSLSIHVEQGQIFGFIGPNGAGKTTTIKILMGLQSATGGTATIFGRDHTEAEARRRVGFLPERPYFYEHLTAREMLRFFGQLFDVPKDVRDLRAEELLERVDLRRWGDVPLRKYSKGMLQRVGLCQALIHDPDLLVLDEPMSGLDPVGRALVCDLILEERKKGRTVFFSSHILPDVQALSDEIAIVIKGELKGIGTLDKLIRRTSNYSDIVFSGEIQGEIPNAKPVRDEPQGHVVRVAPEHVKDVVTFLYEKGATVVQIAPERVTLEDVFLSELEKSAAVDQKRMGILA
jgi:ABC-2 type transport system ATP-binding protein